MEIKPKKFIYENQEKILGIILKELKGLFKNISCKVYLVGSSITGEFGEYEKEYQGHKGSDIDLIIFINQKDIPDNWKYLNTEKSWWKLYHIDKLKINKIKHKIDAMVVKENREKHAVKRIKEIWNPLKIK